MSGASIPRAVELVAILLIPKKAANPDQLRKGITYRGGVVSGSRLSGQVKRAFIRGQPGEEALISITARVRILTDDGADIFMVDRGEWRGSRDARLSKNDRPHRTSRHPLSFDLRPALPAVSNPLLAAEPSVLESNDQ
jgi:hypothetical protein